MPVNNKHHLLIAFINHVQYDPFHMMERPPEAPRMEHELSVEKAEKRMRQRIHERLQEGELPRYASFALPTTPQGELILFKRKKDPSAGLYSIVGGKLDESGLTQVAHSTFSEKFSESGFETPTNGLLRELDEELYGEALTAQGIMHPEERARFLEEKLKPSRQAYVYDAPNNSFNALYLIQQPLELSMHPDARELGDMKQVSELKPEEMNPLTRFLLNLSGHTARGMEGITWGHIAHLPTPPDILKAAMNQKKPGNEVVFSSTPKTPSYLIQY